MGCLESCYDHAGCNGVHYKAGETKCALRFAPLGYNKKTLDVGNCFQFKRRNDAAVAALKWKPKRLFLPAW